MSDPLVANRVLVRTLVSQQPLLQWGAQSLAWPDVVSREQPKGGSLHEERTLVTAMRLPRLDSDHFSSMNGGVPIMGSWRVEQRPGIEVRRCFLSRSS